MGKMDRSEKHSQSFWKIWDITSKERKKENVAFTFFNKIGWRKKGINDDHSIEKSILKDDDGNLARTDTNGLVQHNFICVTLDRQNGDTNHCMEDLPSVVTKGNSYVLV